MIERTEVHGLPRAPPEGVSLAGYEGAGVDGLGAGGEATARSPDAEEEWRRREWKRVERRATRVSRRFLLSSFFRKIILG